MALVATIQFSKKVPAETEYSSQGYALSMQTEIPESDPVAIQARIREAYAMVRNCVEQELANGNGKAAPVKETAKPEQTKPEQASNRQIKFVTDLCQQKGIALSQLNQQIRQQYGVTGLYDITRKQASELLDELNGKRRKAA